MGEGRKTSQSIIEARLMSLTDGLYDQLVTEGLARPGHPRGPTLS